VWYISAHEGHEWRLAFFDRLVAFADVTSLDGPIHKYEVIYFELVI
jgi:hypothetical protein